MTSCDSLDSILTQVGDFRKYQIFTFSLVTLAITLYAALHLGYVFTAMDLDYRCSIPKCDDTSPQYEPPWLPNAIPFTEKGPSKCLKYKINNTTQFDNCSKANFASSTETCSSFIYKTDKYSILREFDLHCHHNLWKLTLVGTINNVGQFLGLFITGMISDRFGRKVVLILGLALCGSCGIIRTFAPSYEWFLAFEFLDSLSGAGSYMCGFILGIELVGPKKRVLAGTLVSSSNALGGIWAGGAAWLAQSWKQTIYILYAPPIFILCYFWLIPESVRWNLSKGRLEEAKKTLRCVARINGKPIAESSLDKLAPVEKIESGDTYLRALKSRTLLLRLITCCFCWITCAFLFYGLTLNSVTLAGNSYMDFILTALAEIPAYIVCSQIMDRLGRKWSLTCAFFITGLSCLLFLIIPEDSENGRLAVYLIGKFGATAAFVTIYVLTSELFPTSLRQSMMGTCSTFARIGSMVAPQTPLLAQLWDPLPIVMFASMATVAGLLSLLFPDTLGIKLPNTIEEAENIGKRKSRNKFSETR